MKYINQEIYEITRPDGAYNTYYRTYWSGSELYYFVTLFNRVNMMIRWLFK